MHKNQINHKEKQEIEGFCRVWKGDLVLNPALVDQLAETSFGVKYLLVRQDLSYRTVHAKELKTKDFKETVRAPSTSITRINHHNQTCVNKGTEVREKQKKFDSQGI